MEQLGFNVPLSLAQVINFLIVLLALRLFLYKPVLEMLDRRAQRVREGLEAAENVKEQAAEAEQEVAQQLEDARRQGQAVDRADPGSSVPHPGRVAHAGPYAKPTALLERARSEIQLERDQAIAELRKEFADLTMKRSRKGVGQSLDKQAGTSSSSSRCSPSPRFKGN